MFWEAGGATGLNSASPTQHASQELSLLQRRDAHIPPAVSVVMRLYASEWGERVRMRGGWGRSGHVIPPAWSSTRSR
jgi:hypothetical protein